MRRTAPSALVLLGLALAGCTTQGNAVRDVAQSVGIGPKSVAAPDFVAASRPQGGDYMPVGISAPRPAVRPRSADRVGELQAELDGARGRNAARGAQAERAGAAVKPKPAPPAPADPE